MPPAAAKVWPNPAMLEPYSRGVYQDQRLCTRSLLSSAAVLRLLATFAHVVKKLVLKRTLFYGLPRIPERSQEFQDSTIPIFSRSFASTHTQHYLLLCFKPRRLRVLPTNTSAVIKPIGAVKSRTNSKHALSRFVSGSVCSCAGVLPVVQ
jgi:hypothetical protein